MRKLLILILTVSVIGCDKDDDNDNGFDAGVYKGTFQRITNTASPAAPVTLNLGDDSYNGQTEGGYYPVIGRGRYDFDGGKISFQDSLFYTANFDWTLILSGDYEYSLRDDSLIILRNYQNGNNFQKDIYRLKKQ